MPFYEVIYEDGSHGVMCCENEEEMLEGVKEQHRRAVNGEMGGPANDRPASRVVKVLEYDQHPNDFNLEQVVTDAEVTAAVKDALKANSDDGAVSLHAVLADVRNLTDPMVASAPHESNYKMEQNKAVSPKKWQLEGGN